MPVDPPVEFATSVPSPAGPDEPASCRAAEAGGDISFGPLPSVKGVGPMSLQSREADTVGQPSPWAPLHSRVYRSLFMAQFGSKWDVDAERCGPMVFGGAAQQRCHRRTGPDGQPWTDPAVRIVRRRACRSVRPAAVTDISAVVCRAGGLRTGAGDLPRLARPDITVDVHRGHRLRGCAHRAGVAGDSARDRPA